jgi:predicted small secreted protein
MKTKRSFEKMVLAAAFAGAALALTSCSTAYGFGQDVKRTGNNIQRAATN